MTLVAKQRTARRLEVVEVSAVADQEDEQAEETQNNSEEAALSARELALQERERKLAAREASLAAGFGALTEAQRATALDILEAPPKETETSMITTENMPGGSGFEKPLIELVEFAPRHTKEVRQSKHYSGADIGPCERTVYLENWLHSRQIINVTFAPHEVYSIEFFDGRAQVPQRIADYIAAHNPGGCMVLS